MRVLAIENYPKTTLGLVGAALGETGAECRILRTHAGDTVPASPDGFDALILLGGAQDALDDANYPFLQQATALRRVLHDRAPARDISERTGVDAPLHDRRVGSGRDVHKDEVVRVR
ncbi:MAG TPA: hypothetical protein VGA77_01695, partial [Propylenella sp.]